VLLQDIPEDILVDDRPQLVLANKVRA
jgi:hypothetical protein